MTREVGKSFYGWVASVCLTIARLRFAIYFFIFFGWLLFTTVLYFALPLDLYEAPKVSKKGKNLQNSTENHLNYCFGYQINLKFNLQLSII